MKALIGEEAFELASRLVNWFYPRFFVEGARLIWESQGEPLTFCSPQYLNGLREVLEPNRYRGPLSRGWRSLDDLAFSKDSYKITDTDLRNEIIKLIEKEPSLEEYELGLYFNANRQLVYYCSPKVAAHI